MKIGFESPGIILQEMKAVDINISKLAVDIAQQIPETDFAESFLLFQEEWLTFFNEYKSGPVSWAARWSSDSVTQMVMDFRNRTIDWVLKFQEIGGRTNIKLTEKKIKTSWWTYGIIGTGIAAVAIIFMSERTRLMGAKAGLIRASKGAPKSHKKGSY